jgi:hypothetical protein
MTEALHRVVYDATVDDAVDVSLRLANRTQAFRKQIRQNVVVVGSAAGLAFVAWWLYTGGGRALVDFLLVVAAGVAFGIVVARLFRWFFEKEIRKQHRKIVAEQFGGKPTIPSELELRPEALWVRQAGMEMTLPWTLCTGILDNPGEIEMNFAQGLCVVRNKHFSSPPERQSFLDTARRLAGTPTV